MSAAERLHHAVGGQDLAKEGGRGTAIRYILTDDVQRERLPGDQALDGDRAAVVCYLEFAKFSNNLHYVDYERLPIEKFSGDGESIPHNVDAVVVVGVVVQVARDQHVQRGGVVGVEQPTRRSNDLVRPRPM